MKTMSSEWALATLEGIAFDWLDEMLSDDQGESNMEQRMEIFEAITAVRQICEASPLYGHDVDVSAAVDPMEEWLDEEEEADE
jgi:hypothetical protein